MVHPNFAASFIVMFLNKLGGFGSLRYEECAFSEDKLDFNISSTRYLFLVKSAGGLKWPHASHLLLVIDLCVHCL